jgi:hypothetical protein
MARVPSTMASDMMSERDTSELRVASRRLTSSWIISVALVSTMYAPTTLPVQAVQRWNGLDLQSPAYLSSDEVDKEWFLAAR